MNEMNVFDGITGQFLYYGKFDETKAREELEKGNAVEIFNRTTNEPVRNTKSYSIRTDEDGFASLL